MTRNHLFKSAAITSRRSHPAGERTGSILIMFLIMLVALVSVGAMAVDLALVEAARTDIRIVADLSAQAASIEFTETGSISDAKARAQDLASRNQVVGSDFALELGDIQAGHSDRQINDKYIFNDGGTPTNSFKVNARLDADSVNGSLQTLFPNVHHRSSVDLAQTSTVTEIYLDIVIVLDRSGSMAFDLSGTDWQYPDGQSWTYNYFLPPQPESRWASLENAIQVFLEEMGRKEKKERVALVSYSSNYSTYSSHYGQYYYANEVDTNANFTENYDEILNATYAIGNSEIVGGTAISAGIDRARTLLANSEQASYSEKIIVLMTDGQWNTGYNPVNAAVSAADEDIIIHTISFGPGSNYSVMRDVADATGGDSYNAASDTELKNAFREIARSIGLSLTE